MAKLEGGCLCGAVRYRITSEPMVVCHCHCRSCRMAAGAPFITWMTVTGTGFAVSRGKPATFRSSAKVERGFCVVCGTALTYRSDDYPDEIDVTAASLDDPALVNPADHIFVGERLPWVKMADGLPELAGSHWEHGYPAKTD